MWKEDLVYKTLSVYALHYLGAGQKRNGDKGHGPQSYLQHRSWTCLLQLCSPLDRWLRTEAVSGHLCPHHSTLYMLVERVDEQMRSMDFGASSSWP